MFFISKITYLLNKKNCAFREYFQFPIFYCRIKYKVLQCQNNFFKLNSLISFWRYLRWLGTVVVYLSKQYQFICLSKVYLEWNLSIWTFFSNNLFQLHEILLLQMHKIPNLIQKLKDCMELNERIHNSSIQFEGPNSKLECQKL